VKSHLPCVWVSFSSFPSCTPYSVERFRIRRFFAPRKVPHPHTERPPHTLRYLVFVRGNIDKRSISATPKSTALPVSPPAVMCSSCACCVSFTNLSFMIWSCEPSGKNQVFGKFPLCISLRILRRPYFREAIAFHLFGKVSAPGTLPPIVIFSSKSSPLFSRSERSAQPPSSPKPLEVTLGRPFFSAGLERTPLFGFLSYGS